MQTLRAPSGASDLLAHALELADRGVQSSLKKLDTNDQGLFWSEMEQFAAAQIGHKTNIPLVVGEQIPLLVREALRDLEAKISKPLRGLPGSDRDNFWQVLRDSAAEQAAQTRPPKVRAGGGQFSF